MDNYSRKKELKEKFHLILEQSNWMEELCTDTNGTLLSLCDDENFAKMMNDISSFGFFQSEEQAKELLHSFLIFKMDEICDWLLKQGNISLYLDFDTGRTIGTVWNEQKEKVNATKLRMTLKKNYRKITKHEFIVIFFHPIL